MIKINLAGILEKAPKTKIISSEQLDVDLLTPNEIQKKGVVRLFALFILPALLYVYETQSVPAKSRYVAQLNQQLADLQAYNLKAEPAQAELRKFKDDEAKIQQRIGTIETLSRDRLLRIQILDIIQQIMPEKVWLERIESKDGKFSITGLGVTDYDISGFLESLERSVYIQNLRPGAVSETIYEGVPVRKFEVSFSYGVPQ